MLCWLPAYISSEPFATFLARNYFYVWGFVIATDILLDFWVLLAFFIAAAAGKQFGEDFAETMGILVYITIFMYIVYTLYVNNQLYYGWEKTRDEIIRIVFPSWNLEEEQPEYSEENA